MGSEDELRRRLLGNGHGEESSRIREMLADSTTATAPKRLPRFSLVDYMPLNGIPSRVLRPSNDGKLFTCHAFSADKQWLATGEIGGCIRLWRTADYKFVAEKRKVFDHAVDCLRFIHNKNDSLIAVDARGYYQCMKLPWSDGEIQLDATSATDGDHCSLSPESGDGFQNNIPPPLPYSNICKHQFSRDGRILLRVQSKSTYFEQDYEIRAIEVIDLGNSTPSIVQLDEDGKYRKGIPLLSENGEGVLVCSMSKTEVWPKLDFKTRTGKQHSITLDGTCAIWGLHGVYLLLWRTDCEEPTISVYKTADLHGLRRGKKPKPRWERRFPAGQSLYEARPLEPFSDSDKNVEVLIAETDVRGNRRVLIWDAIKDSENAEMLISAKIQTAQSKTSSKIRNRTVGGIAESSQSDPDAESCKHRHRIVEAVHPKFCISKNRQWIGTFSRKFQSCFIASVTSGATVWCSGFPKYFQSAQHDMPTEAMFDPSGDHFLIIDERAIVVCAPEFLDDKPLIEESDQTFVKAYACLPSQALVNALEDREHNCGVPSWIADVSRNIDDGCSISDATLSGDRKRIAFIVSNSEASSQPIRSSRIVCLEEQDDRPLLDLPFNDDRTRADSESFIPSRLFLYDNGSGPDQGLVAFSLLEKPTAMFIDMCTGSKRQKKLENIDRCLQISQTADRKRMTILDIKKVIILDLRSETTSKIEYKVDFEILLGIVTSNTKWECKRRLNRRKGETQNRVSDNGHSVLLSWDQARQESIVVHPSSGQQEVESLLKQPSRVLSDYCTLSSDGKATCFIDMREISNDRITIGIFNESDRRVFHRVHIPFGEIDRMEEHLDDIFSIDVDFINSTRRSGKKKGTSDVKPERSPSDSPLLRFLTTLLFGTSELLGMARSIDFLHEPKPEQQELRSPAEKMATVFCGVSDDGSDIFLDGGHLLSLFPTWGKRRIRGFTFKDTEDSTVGYKKLDARDREDIDKCFQKLVENNSPFFVNTPYGSGQSFFREAFRNGDQEVIECCVTHADKNDVLLDVGNTPCFEDAKEEAVGPPSCNIIEKLKDLCRRCLSIIPTKNDRLRREESSSILKAALEEKSNERVKEAVELVCSPTTPFRSAARIMKTYYQQLLKEYREVMMTILSHESMFLETCQPRIYDDFLKTASTKNKDSLLGTSNTVLDWAFIDSPKVIEKTWKSRNRQIANKRECKEDRATVKASLKILRIEDAAQIGMNGIIRPLLLQNAPVNLFCSEAVKNVVRYKWVMFWKRRFRRYAGFYAIFLIVFTAYSTLVARSAAVCEGDQSIDSLKYCCLALMFVFGLKMFFEEVSQLITFVKDGQKYLGSKMSGVAYFFKSIWNWVDLATCMFLLLFIPALHISACLTQDSIPRSSDNTQEDSGTALDQALSATLAVEAVLVSTKAWYFAQPFQSFGALVLMVRSVIIDCIAFLVLSFAVVFGFGLALHILHRHAPAVVATGSNGDDEKRGDYTGDYGSLHRSLLTLFYALFGSFDDEFPDVNRFFTPLFTLFFSFYMIVAVLLLLNLLIAIMGDTFDKTKSSEESQMLMARASFIDACEASLSRKKRSEIEKETSKYLCILEYADVSTVRKTSSWMGKLNMLEERFKSCIMETEKTLKEETRRQNECLKNEMGKYDAHLKEKSQKQDETLKEELKKQNENMKDELKKQNEKLCRLVQEMIRNIETGSKITKALMPTADSEDKPDETNSSGMETGGEKQEDTAARKEDDPESGSASGEGPSNL